MLAGTYRASAASEKAAVRARLFGLWRANRTPQRAHSATRPGPSSPRRCKSPQVSHAMTVFDGGFKDPIVPELRAFMPLTIARGRSRVSIHDSLTTCLPPCPGGGDPLRRAGPDRGIPRGRGAGRHARDRDALQPGDAVARSRRWREHDHALLSALRAPRRAGQADAGRGLGAEPGPVVGD